MRRNLPLAIPALLIAILACNLPGTGRISEADALLTQAAEDLTATAQAATAQATATATSTATATPTATQAASPTAGSTSVPCNMASFVTDVTIPDNTSVAFDQPFIKTWRLKNVGSCTWTSQYQVVFDSGEQMGGPASQQLTTGSVAPDQTIDVSLNLKAPSLAGTYKGNWKLREPGGGFFALSTGPFWVQIKTQPAAVALPDWPTRKSGDSGAEVSALQFLLVAQGEDLNVDGLFGPMTRSKVQHFQGQNGLAPDGIVGPLTWAKLIIPVQQGSSNQAVRAVQMLLNDKFGFGLAVDGIFGPGTNAAVRDYQAGHGLAVDGIVGPKTWQSLVGS